MPRDAAPVDLAKGFGAVHKFAAVGLLNSQINFLAELVQAKFLQILTFFQQPQALADNFALRLVKARFEKFTYELFEDWTQIGIHTSEFRTIIKSCQYLTIMPRISFRES